jgi:transposase
MAMGTELPEDKLGSSGAQRQAALEERDKKLLKMMQQGLSMDVISARLGIHGSTLRGRAKKMGWRYDRERGIYRNVNPEANAGTIAARC